eukprot:5976068-Amphidinium_carterae.2
MHVVVRRLNRAWSTGGLQEIRNKMQSSLAALSESLFGSAVAVQLPYAQRHTHTQSSLKKADKCGTEAVHAKRPYESIRGAKLFKHCAVRPRWCQDSRHSITCEDKQGLSPPAQHTLRASSVLVSQEPAEPMLVGAHLPALSQAAL